MRDITRLAAGKVTIEYALHIFAVPCFDQIASEMGTTDHIGIGGELVCTLQYTADAYLSQLIGHLLRAFTAPATHFFETFDQRFIFRVDA
jgi:hypothetical protein